MSSPEATEEGSRPPASVAATTAADPDRSDRRPFALGGSGTGCPKRSAVAGFPEDPVLEILSGLPAKSLCRFKCVSKGWCELITDRLRCGKLPQTLEGFFYGCVDGFGSEGCSDSQIADSGESGSGDSDESGSEDSDEGDSDDGEEGTGEDYGQCVSKEEHLPQHVCGHFINLPGISVPLVDPLFSFLRKQPGIRSLTLLDSCNGLLLFGHKHDSDICDTKGYIVYNPATEHWVPVPSSGFKSFTLKRFRFHYFYYFDEDDGDRESCVSTYLIFDPVASSHFQLIEFGQNPEVAVVYIYSSETGKWGARTSEQRRWKSGGEWNMRKTIKSMRGSAFLNKMLHLIVSPSSVGPELIAAINGKGETCRVICWLENRGFPIFVGQSKGLLHCLSVSGQPDGNSCHMTELSIWALKDYDAEEWELKHTVSFLELFGKESCQFGSDYKVATMHPEQNLVFFVQHEGYKLVSYDMDCKEVCALCTVGCDYGLITPYVPYFSSTPVLSKRVLCNCFQLGYICKN